MHISDDPFTVVAQGCAIAVIIGGTRYDLTADEAAELARRLAAELAVLLHRGEAPIPPVAPPLDAGITAPPTFASSKPATAGEAPAAGRHHPLWRWLRLNEISQEVFAERLGVSRGAVSRWINGTGRPSSALAEKVERLTAGAIRAHDLRRDRAPQPMSGRVLEEAQVLQGQEVEFATSPHQETELQPP